MKKVAYVSLTILLQYNPEDVGLDKYCSEHKFGAAVEDSINTIIEQIEDATGLIVDEIETDINGFD